MFKVTTAEGDKFLVQLIGPKSYRMGNQITHRGGTLTVSKNTRDYLVRKTQGAWADFDPTPQDEIQEIMPPQFGDVTEPLINRADLDPKTNPPMTMEHARVLASREVDLASKAGNTRVADPAGPDVADLSQRAKPVSGDDEGRGDMTSKDLNQGKAPASGGKTATAKGGMTIETKSTKDVSATTVS